MAEDSDLERTEPASARRIEQAREQGQVPRSQELNNFMVLLVCLLVIFISGESLWLGLEDLMRRGLTLEPGWIKSPRTALEHLLQLSIDASWLLAPLFIAATLTALITPLLLSGWLITFETLSPNFGKLNPLSGIARMFSLHSLVELVKTLLKASLIGGAAVWVLWQSQGELLGLISEPLPAAIRHLGSITRHVLLWLLGAMFVIAAIDVPWQLWEYFKNLRMTKEELRQEMKEAEGDPQVKARIRQIQREAARRRMLQSVPKADVIVTNPTHYAVALQYDQGSMGAPRVIAKGAFKIAEQIVSRAEEHRITILQAPPFARALYFHAPLDKDIPLALFKAAAEVLAYVYQLRVYQNSGGTQPQQPTALEVPAELDPGEKAEIYDLDPAGQPF
jgi:flagellar biosynthesis protein FlhB